MSQINILLLCGGDGSEHDISLVSAAYLKEQLEKIQDFNVIQVVIHRNYWENTSGGQACLGMDRQLRTDASQVRIDYAIPCIHGIPGETGDIQSFLEITGIPYLGCPPEGSALAFNKISTKLWFNAAGIPNTPFTFIDSPSSENLKKVHDFFNKYGAVFVKASSQGSSVGCYMGQQENLLEDYIDRAFSYSSSVLVEKCLRPRELETAVYEYQGKLVVTRPGEIITPNNNFYTFEEKYNQDSHSCTMIEAEVSSDIQNEIIKYAEKAFRLLKLKDLSRIDFFYTEDDGVLLNEINTFPGMTPISMFPKMLENHGELMHEFLRDRVLSALRINNG